MNAVCLLSFLPPPRHTATHSHAPQCTQPHANSTLAPDSHANTQLTKSQSPQPWQQCRRWCVLVVRSWTVLQHHRCRGVCTVRRRHLVQRHRAGHCVHEPVPSGVLLSRWLLVADAVCRGTLRCVLQRRVSHWQLLSDGYCTAGAMPRRTIRRYHWPDVVVVHGRVCRGGGVSCWHVGTDTLR